MNYTPSVQRGPEGTQLCCQSLYKSKVSKLLTDNTPMDKNVLDIIESYSNTSRCVMSMVSGDRDTHCSFEHSDGMVKIHRVRIHKYKVIADDIFYINRVALETLFKLEWYEHKWYHDVVFSKLPSWQNPTKENEMLLNHRSCSINDDYIKRYMLLFDNMYC